MIKSTFIILISISLYASSYDDLAKEYLQKYVKDPSSLQVENTYIGNYQGTTVLCGMLNAKNSFGGYTGYQRFTGNEGSMMIESANNSRDFRTVWNMCCN